MPDLGQMMEPAPTAPAAVAAQATPPKTPEEQQKLEEGWKGVLKNPAIISAMMQMSLNMLQPRANGQSLGGQIGQAIGAGGEAANRVLEQQSKDEQQATQNALRSREVAATESNAATNKAQLGIQSEHNQILGKQIASQEQIAKERKEVDLKIARLGYDKTMEQIKAQLESNERVTNRALLQEIIRSEGERFKAESENSLTGGAQPRAATPGEIMQKYQLYDNSLKTGGRVPDEGPVNSLIKDQEVIDRLNSPDPAMQAQGRQLTQFMSPTQIARIMGAVKPPAVPPPAPMPGMAPKPGTPAPRI